MPRPAFSLTDDQARLLAIRVAELQAIHPFDRRNHRPFVRGFLRAVREATGKLYSPAIYQRLLSAFAPERRPSTATLAAEKQALADEYAARPAVRADAGDTLAGDAAPADWGPLRGIVADAIDAGLARAARGAGTGGAAQTAFYAARLRDAEQRLGELRAECARLGADLAAARQSAGQHAAQAERAAAGLEKQTSAVAALTGELADIRKFALQSIDEARGEARLWKERSATLEAQLQRDARLLETFRQSAYRQGAPIPASLLQDKPR